MRFDRTSIGLVLLIILLGGELLPAQTPVLQMSPKGVWPGFLRGSVSHVTVVSNIAYVVADWNGHSEVAIYDVTTPADPYRLGSYPTLSPADDVQVLGGVAYIADSRWTGSNYVAGLDIVDVGNPSQPVFRRRYDLRHDETISIHVYASGHYAYLAVEAVEGGMTTAALEILDVSSPIAPLPLGVHELHGSPQAIQVVGPFAYVATQRFWLATNELAGLEIVDLTDPAQPASVGTYDLSQSTGGARDVSVAGALAYLATDSGLEIVDISNPAIPFRDGIYLTPGGRSVRAVSWYAYVSGTLPGSVTNTFSDGLEIIDVRNTASPSLLGLLRLPGRAGALCIKDGYAFLASGDGGLEVLDVRVPGQPMTLSNGDAAGPVLDVTIAGQLAYLTEASVADPAKARSLAIVDVSDPAEPQRAGRYQSTNALGKIRIAGQLGFLPASVNAGSNQFGALEVLSLTNPLSPVLVGEYVSTQSVVSVTVSGDYAYLAGGTSMIGTNASGDYEIQNYGGLEIIDLHDPTSPVRVGSYFTNGLATDVAVSGPYAYVADGIVDLRVLDISNPAQPTVVGLFDTNVTNPWTGSTGGPTRSLALLSNYVYAAGEDGLHVLNIQDPVHPQPVNSFGGSALCAIGSDSKYAATAGLFPNGLNGPAEELFLLDVLEPGTPWRIGGYGPLEPTCGFYLSQNLLYVAGGSEGLLVFQVTEAPYIRAISRVGGTLTLKWNGAPNLKLQSTSSLENQAWVDVAGSQDLSSLQLPLGAGRLFFRLAEVP
jgi:hypothetical protein